MNNLIVLAYLCGMTVLPCWLLKKRFEQVFGIMLMLSVLLVFISGFFGYMMEVVYGLLGWAVISSIMVLWLGRKELRELFSLLITPAFLVLTVCYLLMFILFHERLLYEWDEIAFWGPFARETYRLGEFYNSVNSVVDVHLSYPPASTLFEYIVVLLYGQFNEPHLLQAIHTLCLAMLLPCLKGIRLSDVHIWAPVGLLAFLLPGIAFSSFYGNIYPDALLGLCMGYALYQAFLLKRDDTFGYIGLAITTSFMLLIKDVGFIFALIVIVTVAIKICFFGGKFWQNPEVKMKAKARAAIGVSAVVLVPMVFYGMWSVRVADMGSQFDKGDLFSLTELGDLFGGRAPEYQYETLSAFNNRIFSVGSSDAPVAFSYMGWMALLCGIMLILITIRYRKGERKSPHWVNLCVVGGGLAYALGMLILYLFRFGEYSGPKLASYDRYMNTYILAYLAFVFMCAVGMFTETRQRKPHRRLASMLPGVAALALTLAFLLPPAFVERVFMNEDLEHHYLMNKRKEIAEQAEELQEYVNIYTDKVYLIIQRTRGFEYHSMRFETMPMKTNGNYEWSIGELYPPSSDGELDYWTLEMTPDEFARTLREGEYDYVYLQRVDTHFENQFSGLFYDPTQIYDGNILYVVPTADSVKLVTYGRMEEYLSGETPGGKPEAKPSETTPAPQPTDSTPMNTQGVESVSPLPGEDLP